MIFYRLLYYKKGETEPKKYPGTRDLSSLANFLNEQFGTNVAVSDLFCDTVKLSKKGS